MAEEPSRCYDNSGLHNLAEFTRNCDKCTVDLKDTNDALNQCVSNGSDSGIIIPFLGGAAAAFILCAVFGPCDFKGAK